MVVVVVSRSPPNFSIDTRRTRKESGSVLI